MPDEPNNSRCEGHCYKNVFQGWVLRLVHFTSQGPVARKQLSIETDTFLWLLTLVSANDASSNLDQIETA